MLLCHFGRDQRLLIDINEAKIVRYIYRKYLELHSMPHIAYILNKRGVKPKRGGRWTATSVRLILTNQLYTGHYNITGIESEIKAYRIISKKTFNLVQNLRQSHGRSREPMPLDRKAATVEKIVNQYIMNLDEEERFIQEEYEVSVR